MTGRSEIVAGAWIARAAILGALLAISSCSTLPVSNVGALDPRFSWPCDRLVVEWAVPADILEQALEPSLEVREAAGEGNLQLQVMHCRPGRPAAGIEQYISYAIVLVPLVEGSAPVALTRSPPDGGWLALHRAAASGPARVLLEELGYAVVEAAQDFAITGTRGRVSVEVELQFDAGRVSIKANPTGDSSSWTDYVAYVGSGAGYVSTFFGEEVSERYLASATVRFEGKTPLSRFNLGASPAVVKLDRQLVSERVYWRLPSG